LEKNVAWAEGRYAESPQHLHRLLHLHLALSVAGQDAVEALPDEQGPEPVAVLAKAGCLQASEAAREKASAALQLAVLQLEVLSRFRVWPIRSQAC